MESSSSWDELFEIMDYFSNNTLAGDLLREEVILIDPLLSSNGYKRKYQEMTGGDKKEVGIGGGGNNEICANVRYEKKAKLTEEILQNPFERPKVKPPQNFKAQKATMRNPMSKMGNFREELSKQLLGEEFPLQSEAVNDENSKKIPHKGDQGEKKLESENLPKKEFKIPPKQITQKDTSINTDNKTPGVKIEEECVKNIEKEKEKEKDSIHPDVLPLATIKETNLLEVFDTNKPQQAIINPIAEINISSQQDVNRNISFSEEGCNSVNLENKIESDTHSSRERKSSHEDKDYQQKKMNTRNIAEQNQEINIHDENIKNKQDIFFQSHEPENQLQEDPTQTQTLQQKEKIMMTSSDLSQKLEKVKNEIYDLKQSKRMLEENYEDAKRTISVYQKEITALRNELQEFKMKEIKEGENMLKLEISHLNMIIKHKTSENEILNHENTELKEHIESLHRYIKEHLEEKKGKEKYEMIDSTQVHGRDQEQNQIFDDRQEKPEVCVEPPEANQQAIEDNQGDYHQQDENGAQVDQLEGGTNLEIKEDELTKEAMNNTEQIVPEQPLEKEEEKVILKNEDINPEQRKNITQPTIVAQFENANNVFEEEGTNQEEFFKVEPHNPIPKFPIPTIKKEFPVQKKEQQQISAQTKPPVQGITATQQVTSTSKGQDLFNDLADDINDVFSQPTQIGKKQQQKGLSRAQAKMEPQSHRVNANNSLDDEDIGSLFSTGGKKANQTKSKTIIEGGHNLFD